LKRHVAALEDERNAKSAKVNWQFTNAKAREKMQHRYPTYQSILVVLLVGHLSRL